jgi:phage terminase large subunit GpA-like protein
MKTITIPNKQAAKIVVQRTLDAVKPPPDLSISEWADQYRVLSSEASSEYGAWNTSRAEYQRGIMDAISDDNIEEVTIMSCAQVGKTEMILNLIGYHVAQDPAPMLVVQPTLEMAQTFSKDRLAPMVRDCPTLADKIKDPRARDSGNSILKKQFAGGHITMCGANSPSSLASRPVRLVLCDEVDRFPNSAGTEGDPIDLAKRRATTFTNRKIVMVSTPTVKDASRIEAAFEETDKREYHVPCKDCGEEQVLRWSNVKWDKDAPETAAYICEHCGSVWDDAARFRAIRRGRWVATNPSVGKAGFRLSGLCSPWTPIESAVREFLEAKKLPETLRVWVNTYLGETFAESGERVQEHDIAERREDWGEKVPNGVVMVTAGIDVQDDRLEVEVLGIGRDEETWSLDYKVLYGDPAAPQLWSDLDALMATTYEREDGFELIIQSGAIDTGGHFTQAVYKYCKPRYGRRIFAIKGVGGEGKPLVGRPSTNNNMKCKLFPIGVDTAKEIVYSRLRIQDKGAGYCHFPIDRDDEYFRMLTAEEIVTRFHKGFRKREWRKTRARNEALDCRVYAIAASAILNTNINAMASRQKARQKPDDVAEEVKVERRTARRRPPSTGFANSWR